MLHSLPSTRAAWLIAVAADVVQVAIVPMFGPGFASPVNDALDVAVAILLSMLLGWHWAFLPAFAVELVPMVDLVPSWTMACWIATRGRGRTELEPPEAEIVE